jgi:hypothetical protein
MNLEQTAAGLLEQFPTGSGSSIAKAEVRLERFGRIAFGGLGIVLVVAVLGIVYAIIRNFIIAGDQPLVGVILAFFVIFAALTLAWVVMNEDLKDKRKKRGLSVDSLDSTLAQHDTNKLLTQPADAAVNSVTENTTNLLPVEDRTRKLEN